jgi:hypothetical protein
MRAIRCGISYWGICADFIDHRDIHIDTPDGHRYGRPLLVKALKDAGHEVFALQQRREPSPFNGLQYAVDVTHNIDDQSSFPDLDVIFLEWRWSTHKNDHTNPNFRTIGYEPDLDRQREIIEFYRGKIPIIAWDTDLKITPEDEERYPELILSDPSFETNRLTRDRTSLPFWTDWKEIIPVNEPYQIYGYVGNNYERPDEFKKFYFTIEQDTRNMGIQTAMYGNWLQKSPDRESPSSLISTYREVAFNHRMNFYESMQLMNRFICTTHVSKPRYYETGFISPRYVEALACNCPALVPTAQRYKAILGRGFDVNDGSEVIEAIKRLKDLTITQRAEIVASQRDALKQSGKFDVQNVVNFIESHVH